MPLYTIQNNVDDQYASDVNQLVDGLTGNADIGQLKLLSPLSAPTAPTAAVNTNLGNLTGAYKYAALFVTGYWHGEPVTGTLLVQGNTGYGTASNTINPNGQQGSISAIPTGPTGTVARILARTKAGGSTFYQLAQINDNTTTSWTDNTPDTSLTVVLTQTNTTGSKFVGDGSGLTGLAIPTTYGPETGLANAYVVTLTPAPTSLTAGMVVVFLAVHANTGASTLNPNGLGVKSIKMENGSDPVAGTIPANSMVQVVYDGTNFRFLATGLAAHQADYAHHYFADGGSSTDDYAITPNPAITAYVAGQTFNVKANTANTGAATLNVSAKGAKTIKKYHNEDLATGDIVAGQIFTVVYDAGDDTFQLTSGIKASSHGSLTGTYIGDGTSNRTIPVGVVPVLAVVQKTSSTTSGVSGITNNTSYGVFQDGYYSGDLKLAATGFIVNGGYLNTTGETYRYTVSY